MKKLSVVLVLILGLTGCAAPQEEQIPTPSPTPTPEEVETPPVEKSPTPIPTTPAPEIFGLETQVFYYEPYPLAFYNTFYELEVPDITFEVYNPMDNPVTVRLTSEYQGISYKAITTETIMPDERKTINQTIPLNAGEIENIKTKTKITLHYKIEYEKDGEWKNWDEQTIMIDFYPKDTMVWAMRDEDGSYIDLYGYIAVFVTPKADEEWTIYTASQIEAIYYALHDYVLAM